MGGKGEGSGDWVPPCSPPLYSTCITTFINVLLCILDIIQQSESHKHENALKYIVN